MHTCFTTGHYIELLTMIKDAGYRFIYFDEYQENVPDDNLTIMRHDVDLSVEYAYRLAQIEYNLQVKSTYFFLITSPFYNICEPSYIRMIQEIISMGHQVGLHYDHHPYEQNNIDIKQSILREAAILSSVIENPVRVFSFHRPRSTLFGSYEDIGMIDAYGSYYLNHFKYISDSNHQWKEGCLSAHIARHKRLYALIHPIWWIHITPKTPFEKISLFRSILETRSNDVLTNSIKGYKNYRLTSRWE